MSTEQHLIIHIGTLIENTFYMTIVWFSETYKKLGVVSDKLHVKENDKFCRSMQSDPKAVINLSYDSQVGACISSIPECDTESVICSVLKS